MSAVVERARLGAEVVLFEAKETLGGQFLWPETFRARPSLTKRPDTSPPR